MALKAAYSAVELAKILSLTSRAILFRAKRENWKSRERAGRGGGKEWLVSSMPEETQLAIRAAEEKQALGEETPFFSKRMKHFSINSV